MSGFLFCGFLLNHRIPDQGIFSGFIVLHDRWWVVSAQTHTNKIWSNIAKQVRGMTNQ
jgi:hypothetical protein